MSRQLDPESDHLNRVSRVTARALSVFGADDTVTTWLQRPNRALNGKPPILLLDTDAGGRQVEDILGRIEHGIVG